jgi:hypothetical protein
MRTDRTSYDAIKRPIVIAGLLGAFLFTIALSAAPRLHGQLHTDADQVQHECAVTLIGSGKCQASSPPLVFLPPRSALQFSRIPALHPIWVAAPFLGAHVFEHAPPLFS